jgi:hypothetical protein
MIGKANTLNLIPQHWNRYSPVVPRVGFQVQLLQPSHSILRVLVRPTMTREVPAVRRISCIDFDQLNNVLQSFECSNDDSTVRPRTHVVEVENIATSLRRKTLRRYDTAEAGRHSASNFLRVSYFVVIRWRVYEKLVRCLHGSKTEPESCNGDGHGEWLESIYI